MKEKPKFEVLPGYEPLSEWTHIAADIHGLHVEEWMKLYIRVRPRWIPSFIWKWLIRKLIMQVSDGLSVTLGKRT